MTRGAESAAMDIDAWRRNIREFTFGEYHYQMGVAIEREGDVPAAIDAYGRALEIRPGHHAAFWRLEQALRRTGRDAEAEAVRQRALAVDPHHPACAHLAIGVEAYERDDLTAAAAALEAALAKRPGWPPALAQAGLTALAAGDGAAARRFLEPVDPTTLDDEMVAQFIHLGKRRQAAGDVAGGVLALERAALARPGDADAQLYLAIALKVAGRLAESVEHYALAAAARPGAEELGHLAMTLQALGRLDEALERYRQAIDADPRRGWIHANMGLALVEAGRGEEALTALDAAIRIDPSARNHAYLGMALQAKGDARGAVAQYRRALSMDRDLPFVRERLAALEGAGATAGAL